MDEIARTIESFMLYDFPRQLVETWLAIPLNEGGWREPTLGNLAKEMGLTRPGLWNRMHSRVPFKAHEALYIAQRLGVEIPRRW